MNREKAMVENREIDLVDFLKTVLEQWRGWTLCGLLFGVLVMYFVFFKQTYDIAQAQAQTHYYSGVDELKGTDASVAVACFCQWKQWADYANESPVMTLDSKNVRKLTLNYYISGYDIDISPVYECYINLLSDEVLFSSLSETMGMGDDYRYITDIVYVNYNNSLAVSDDIYSSLENNSSASSTTFFGKNISVTIFLPDPVDEQLVEKVVTDYVISKNVKISQEFGKHSISLTSSDIIEVSDSNVADKQASVYSNVYTFRSYFKSVYNSLSGSTKEKVDNVIEKLMLGEVDYESVKDGFPLLYLNADIIPVLEEDGTISYVDQNAGTGIPDPILNPKYALLGFFAGVCIYAGIVLLFIILVSRFRSGDEAADSIGLRSYGDVYEYPYRGVKAFLHDKRVYKWRHKKAVKPEEIAESIVAKAKFGEINNLTCLVLGDGGEFIASSINTVKNNTAKLGVTLDVRNGIHGLSSLKENEMENFAPVLFVVISGQSKPIYAAEILSRLKEYNIPVFGMCFIEGPM